ncbi:hypothetical protein JRY02_13515 [Enterobacter roggenkampii]|nr:hypothetical protein [Enterobacter roggenkampii]
MKILNCKGVVTALPLILLPVTVMASGQHTDMTLRATVIPSCSVSGNVDVIDLGTIPAINFNETSAGQSVGGNWEAFELVPVCPPPAKATITLSTSNDIAPGGCIQSDYTGDSPGSEKMQFCLTMVQPVYRTMDMNLTPAIRLDFGAAEIRKHVFFISAASNGNIAGIGEHQGYITATIAAD